MCLFHSISSYKASADAVHFVFTPIRVYYRVTRYLFGENYQPFEEVREGLHPIAGFYKKYQAAIRILVKSSRYILTSALAFIIYSILRSISGSVGKQKQSIF